MGINRIFRPAILFALLTWSVLAHAELSTTAVWTFEPNFDSAQVGKQVTTAGDVNGDGYSDILVATSEYTGSLTSEGKAWLFLGSASGPGVAPAWTEEGNQMFADLGASVAAAGDVNGDGYDDVIVGAPGFDNGTTDEGAAFCYYGSAAGLSIAPNWTRESNLDQAHFGTVVVGAGDVDGDGYADVLVSAPTYSGGQLREGRVSLYRGSASGLSSVASWFKDGNLEDARLGQTLSPAGDVNGDGYDDVLIGTPFYSSPNPDEGGVWLYLGSSSGLAASPLWGIQGNVDGHSFGSSLGCAGDVNGDGYSDITIGFDTGGTTGTVYVYYGGSGGPNTTADRIYSDATSIAFGSGHFTAGDVNGDGYADIVLGDYLADGSESDQGAIHLYQGAAGQIEATPTTTIFGPTNQSLSHFGGVTSTAGDVNGDGFSDVIVGAPFFASGQFYEGKAYVYLGRASTDEGGTDWARESNQAGADFGISGALGDWNGDGFSDLVVGAWFYDAGQTDEGSAFVYFGGADGLPTSSDWSKDGDQATALFGYALATAGDINGDGYEDLLAGAPLYDNGQSNEGRAFLFYGSAGGLPASASWSMESNQADARFGWSVSSAGDINGDGLSDVIVGAPDYESGAATDEGMAYLYTGTEGGPSLAWTRVGGEANANFGFCVAGAGDVNGDGYSDVIVGAPNKSNGQAAEGVAYIFHGGPAGLSATPNRTLDSDQVAANFGISVNTAGDVNGDGYSDVIVGASDWDNGNTSEGAAFVYLGGPNGVSSVAAWSIEGGQDGAHRGEDVGPAGDVNNDGYSDVVIGMPNYSGSFGDEGRASVFFGGPAGLAGSTLWYVNGGQDGARCGAAVAGAGDVNGDGFSDVAIGQPDYDNVQDSEGRMLVYFGNDGGLDRAVNQMHVDGVSPISLLGQAPNPNGILVRGYARTPLGRDKVRVQFTAGDVGSVLTGVAETFPTRFDTGAPVVGRGSRALVYTPVLGAYGDDVSYHWRMRYRTDSPYFPWSPWFSPARNGENETDFRTAPAPPSSVANGEAPAGPAIHFARVWPNPLFDRVNLSFVLPDEGPARLTIHDVSGRRLRTLLDGREAAGTRTLSWDGRADDGSRLAAGVYFARLDSGGRTATRKLILAR